MITARAIFLSNLLNGESLRYRTRQYRFRTILILYRAAEKP